MAQVIPAPPISKERLETLTQGYIKKWHPEALEIPQPIDVELIFDDEVENETGVVTSYDNLPNGVMGVTDGERMISRVDLELYKSYDIGNIPGIRRCRATSAHEIGHCLLHLKKLKAISSITTHSEASLFRVDQSTLPAYRDPEWQAWYFAGALLMPRSMIFQAIKTAGQSPHKLADIFHVNPKFAEVRLKKLGL